jgi:FHS family Na+ dependent glucose MFS transporter 1
VLAILTLPSALLLLGLPSPKNEQVSQEQSRPERTNYKMVGLISLFLCLYIGVEVSYGGWISTYVLKMNLGNENKGAYLTSAFWGSITIGRLLGVPIAARFRPRTILLADLIGCLAGIAVAIGWSTSIVAMTVASFCIGLSAASIYPTALTFAGRRMQITGKVTAFLLVGGAAGGMIVPWMVGQMFEPIGPRVMQYTILIDLILAVIVYLAMLRASVGQGLSTGISSLTGSVKAVL